MFLLTTPVCHQALKATLSKLPNIENPSLERFLAHCRIRSLPSKRPIIAPGDPADTMYYIIEGSATITMQNEAGGDIILGYLNAGDFIGETGLFIRQMNREVMVRTRTKCDVAQITYERLLALSETELKDDFANILFMLGTHISSRLLHANQKVGHLAFLDAAGRIAHTLLALCRQPDALTHPDGMQIKISRTELGRIVGCSREMVGRVLKNMEQQRLISAKGKTIVIYGDRDELFSPDFAEKLQLG